MVVFCQRTRNSPDAPFSLCPPAHPSQLFNTFVPLVVRYLLPHSRPATPVAVSVLPILPVIRLAYRNLRHSHYSPRAAAGSDFTPPPITGCCYLPRTHVPAFPPGVPDTHFLTLYVPPMTGSYPRFRVVFPHTPAHACVPGGNTAVVAEPPSTPRCLPDYLRLPQYRYTHYLTTPLCRYWFPVITADRHCYAVYAVLLPPARHPTVPRIPTAVQRLPAVDHRHTHTQAFTPLRFLFGLTWFVANQTHIFLFHGCLDSFIFISYPFHSVNLTTWILNTYSLFCTHPRFTWFGFLFPNTLLLTLQTIPFNRLTGFTTCSTVPFVLVLPVGRLDRFSIYPTYHLPVLTRLPALPGCWWFNHGDASTRAHMVVHTVRFRLNGSVPFFRSHDYTPRTRAHTFLFSHVLNADLRLRAIALRHVP